MRKDILNYIVGVVLEKFIPFLLLPYFTHLLGSNEYSNLIIFLSYNVIFVILIGFSSDAYYIREIYELEKKDNILSIPLIYNISMFFLLLIFSFFIENYIMLLAIILAFFQVIFNYCLSFYVAFKESKKYVLLSIYFSMLTTVISIILIYLFPIYESRAIAMIISMILMILVFIKKEFIFIKKIKNNFFNFNHREWYPFIYFCFPLVIHQLAFFMKNGFDKLLMYSSDTNLFLASYGLAFQIVMPFSVLFAAFNRAFLPYMYEKLNENDISYVETIISFSWILVIVIFIIFILTWKIPTHIYILLFGDGFDSVGLFVPYFLAGTLMILPYFLSNFILFYNKKTNLIAIFNIASAIIHISLFVTLNSKLYIEYLGVSYLLGQVFLFLFINFLAKRELKILRNKVQKEIG